MQWRHVEDVEIWGVLTASRAGAVVAHLAAHRPLAPVRASVRTPFARMLSERRILCLKSDIRLEWRGQDGQDETEQGTHYPLTLGDSLSRSIRMRFSVHTATGELSRFDP